VLAVRSTALVHSIISSSQSTALVTTAWAAGSDSAQTAGATPRPTATQATKFGEPARPERAAEKKPGAADALKPDEQPPAIEGPPPATDGERAVLLELRQRRQELEAREATLAARESMLAAMEQKLTARVEELQALQKKLESLDASHKQQEDAAWQGLVKVYETMKPRDAAVIFNELGMQVLLAVVDRMKEAKAAAILAAMAPDKAREVTMQLAQSRAKTTVDADPGGKPAISPPSAPPPSALGPGKAPGSGT
jgi:flagellar motility protein MotE (MotC chaperone)